MVAWLSLNVLRMMVADGYVRIDAEVPDPQAPTAPTDRCLVVADRRVRDLHRSVIALEDAAAMRGGPPEAPGPRRDDPAPDEPSVSSTRVIDWSVHSRSINEELASQR